MQYIAPQRPHTHPAQLKDARMTNQLDPIGGWRAWRKSKLALAVSAATAFSGGGAAPEGRAPAIETIVVTATKRSASMQDVAVPVQAMTGDDLRDLGVATFDEYARFLPNVAEAGNGPGKKELYLRGSATEQSGVAVTTQQGSAPGVALYVDEQPVSFGGRNLDVYAADLERIEVLAGPQGTLFGASSQSGNLRLITRKPDPLAFSTGFNARYAVTREGAPSAGADGFLNVPVGDSAALRLAIYSDNQGGWVDNVAAIFTPSAEVIDRNSAGYGPRVADADSIVSARNDALVETDWNDASYRGGRLSALYQRGDFEALIQHSAQTLETEGSFLMDPGRPEPHASTTFTPDYNRDEFGLATWTLSGRLAGLDVVYAGGRLARDVDAIVDYTHYNTGGGYIAYYLCSGNLHDAADPNNCHNPIKQFTDATTNHRRTHELRFSTAPAKRWRLLAGVYANVGETTHLGEYHDWAVNAAHAEHISNFHNDDSGDGFQLGNVTLPTEGVVSSGPRAPTVTFFNDYTRTEEELAFFGEIAIDLSDSWSVAVSGRRYDLTSGLKGASNFSFGCRYGIGANARRTADGRCDGHDFSNDVSLRLRLLGQYAASGDEALILNARSPNGEDGTPRDLFRGGGSNQATLNAIKSGQLSLAGMRPDGTINEVDTILKATLSWTPNDALLLFATVSEGYRPATLNRNGGQLANVQTGVFENYAVPPVALTDHLHNHEVGVKADLFDGRLRINATAYATRVADLQISRYDSANVAFNYFIENVGDARAKGVDVDLAWRPTDALAVAGAFALLDTELTRVNPQLAGIAVPAGAELPLSPRFAGNLRVRYDFALPGLDAPAFLAANVVHRGESLAGMVGKAELMDDTLFHQTGRRSGLETRLEGGTFGNTTIPAGDGRRLPLNSRFVNPAATTLNVSLGMEMADWRGELFIDNLNNEAALVAQVGGRYMPVVTKQRPRTVGLRLSFTR